MLLNKLPGRVFTILSKKVSRGRALFEIIISAKLKKKNIAVFEPYYDLWCLY